MSSLAHTFQHHLVTRLGPGQEVQASSFFFDASQQCPLACVAQNYMTWPSSIRKAGNV